MPSRRASIAPLLERIRDAAFGTVPWETVLEGLTQTFRAHGALLFTELRRGGGWGISTGVDARFQADYFAYFAGIQPLCMNTFSIPEGSVLTDEMVMPKAEFRRTEFFADWSRPQGFESVLHLRVENSDAGMIGITLTRPDPFEAEDIALKRRLAPHIRGSIRAHLRLSEALASGRAMAEALDRMRRGMIGLDAAGRIVFANQAARALLAAGDALRAEGGLLAARRPDRTAALRRMIGIAALGGPPGVLVLPRPEGRAPVLAEAVPVGAPAALPGLHPPPTVLLMLSDPEDDRGPAATLLRELYGLTATEAAVAIRIARGEGLEAAARALGIARSTARTHLRSAFGKTDTHRQAELAWLLARLSG